VTNAEKYVTAAYLVVLAVVLLYVVIYAFKMARLEREVARLADLARDRDRVPSAPPSPSRAPTPRLTRQ
jgi:hypothetical protein